MSGQPRIGWRTAPGQLLGSRRGRQQAAGVGPEASEQRLLLFRFTFSPERERQRIVQAHLQQHHPTQFGKAARDRRLAASVNAPVNCGVLLTLNRVPSSASSRQPRQNAWRCFFFWASGRKSARNSSARKAHGNTARRSAKVLSERRTPSACSRPPVAMIF